MLIAGCVGVVVAIMAGLSGLRHSTAILIFVLGFVVAIYGLFMGSYMTYGSRIGKLRSREELLDLAGAIRPWSGNEAVLDVGCGRD